jgi:transcriptional regulator GlxA family with amidase domain
MERRRIGVLGFDNVQALDIVGPCDAFASDAFTPGVFPPGAFDVVPHPAAIDELAGRGRPYEIVIIGLRGKAFTASSGLTFTAHCDLDSAPPLDTLIVPGGSGLRESGAGEAAARWIARRAHRIRRIASVCTGVYGIAPSGLLDGRRVATHWSAVRDVQRRFPKLRVDGDAVYLKDGSFYSSAGITAGIDLALALIEEDCGPNTALAVAREMVVYYKRPGGQNQFSEPLRFQFEAADRFADVAAWVGSHLRAQLTVEALAKRACMSVRHFSREFKERFGVTPAGFVEEVRMAEASRRLAAQRVSIAAVGRSVGYQSEDVFRRAFERRFGVTPKAYRHRFNVASPAFASVGHAHE